jgi:GntR family transcriptional regulator
MFDKNSAVPLHIQLKKLIREQMLTGRLAVHTQLPSERELCEKYAISRTTVRRAMVDLLSEGLVYTTVGKGTFVAPPPIKEELQPLSSFTEDMARRGVHATSQVLKAAIENADDQQAGRLHLPRGAEVVVLHRLRLADGFPIAIQKNCLPHHLCLDLLKFDLAGRSLYQILRTEYHLSLSYADTGIRATLANNEQCRLLRLAPPAALLVSEQTTYWITAGPANTLIPVFAAINTPCLPVLAILS